MLKCDPCTCGNGVFVLRKTKDNTAFCAYSSHDCKITVDALADKPLPSCTCCNTQLRINSKVIFCDCGLMLWKTTAEKTLADNQLVQILNKGKKRADKRV